nr:ionotropic receptor 64a [Pachyrhinus yasumatsui]
MLIKPVVILLGLKFFLVKSLMETNLVLSFLKAKHLKHNTILTCSNRKAQVNLAKQLTKNNNMLISIKSIKFLNILETISTKYKRVGMVLDGDCVDAKGLLLRCKRYKCFDSKHFWLVFYHSSSYHHLFKYAELNVDSDIKVAYPTNEFNATMSKEFIIDDVYNPAYQRGGELKASEVGYYSKKQGYHADELQNKYVARRNLTGVVFRSIVVLPRPFNGTLQDYLLNERDIKINTFNRFHSRLMHYCQEYYNFRLDIKVSKSWGYLQPDGNFDGLVGELERHKIDFGMSPIFVKRDRAKVITYGRKTWNLRAAFVFRNPKSRKSYQIFIKPLSVQVWICIFLSFLTSVLTQKFSYGLDTKRALTDCVESTWSFSTVCTFGAFCQQGIVANPRLLCGRIVAIFTLLLGSLIYQFYSASLVSFLLNVPTTVINSVQGILDNNFKVGCEDVLYFKDFLKYSTDDVIRELHKKLLNSVNNTGFLKPEDGLEKIKPGGYAFHVELVSGYPIIQETFTEKTICELREVPMFEAKAMHANYQKMSPFKDVMDTCLHRLSENGVLNREILFWHPKKPECLRSGTTISINTGLVDFYPALCVLVIGMILSLQILGLEVLWYHRTNRVKLNWKEPVFQYFN